MNSMSPLANMRATLLLFLVLIFARTQAQNFYFENISIEQGLPTSKVYCVVQDAHGLVWMGTEAGLASAIRIHVLRHFRGNEG